MTNIEVISSKIKQNGLEVGRLDRELNKVSKANLKKILDQIEFQGDLFINIDRKLHTIEITECDNEIDIMIYTAEDYFRKYGGLEEKYDNGDISFSQYSKLRKLGL